MKKIEGLKFSEDHEWVRVEGNTAYVGISDYAQHSLGDIVFVDLPKAGSQAKAGKAFGSVESVKAVSDLNSPVTGKIVEINEALNDAPESLNEEPYENWIISVELENNDDLNTLMDEDEYEEFCKREAENA